MVGTAVAHAPVALARGVVELKAKLGTRGIVKARMSPMLSGHTDQNKISGNQKMTDQAQSPNKKKTKTFFVKYFPHKPRSPRFQDFKNSFRDSALSSRLAALVIPRISDFAHSGPSAGTVTISTGFVGSASTNLGVGGGSCW